jgi:mannose-6-phosphate isomerase-like protein (cupin superfamily)
MHVVMDDGQEIDIGPGEAIEIPPGHDAWVVGDEPYVGVDVTGGASYAGGS